MLQIKLRSKGAPSTDGAGGAKPSAGEAVTVACPDHLTIADLPVAKSVGSVAASSVVKTVGRKSRRQQGERVHVCVRCDIPIAIYGRLSHCDHVFCLDCARSDSKCYLCGERIQKIQTLKLFDGIFICAAPECMKSFLKQDEFESHIRQNHNDLLRRNTIKEEGNESEAVSGRKPETSDSTVQAPLRSVLSPGSSSQPQLEPPFSAQTPGIASYVLPDNSKPKGFDRVDPLNQFPIENVDLQGRRQHESGLIQDSQQGVLNENSIPEYAMQFHQPSNMAMPGNPNLVQNPPQFSYPQFAQDGVPFYGSPFQPRQDLAAEVEQRPGSGSGFTPFPTTGPANFGVNYPQPWGIGPTGLLFDSSQLNPGHFLPRGDSHDAQPPPGWQPEHRDKFGGAQG